jgi:hypothetical protein
MDSSYQGEVERRRSSRVSPWRLTFQRLATGAIVAVALAVSLPMIADGGRATTNPHHSLAILPDPRHNTTKLLAPLYETDGITGTVLVSPTETAAAVITPTQTQLIVITQTPTAVSVTNVPGAVVMSPPKGMYSVLIPTNWVYKDLSYPSDHTTDLWYDPSSPEQRIEVLTSGCAGCVGAIEQAPVPSKAVPPGMTTSASISACRLEYAGQYGGDFAASPTISDSLPDSGLVAVISRPGRVVDGFVRMDVWLPSAQRALAEQILHSFQLDSPNTTC